jgi:hypothetical protein
MIISDKLIVCTTMYIQESQCEIMYIQESQCEIMYIQASHSQHRIGSI